MIALTDDELSAVMDAARPIPPASRDAFLHALAAELAQHPVIGEGLIHRVARDVQRKYFDPPDLSGSGAASLQVQRSAHAEKPRPARGGSGHTGRGRGSCPVRRMRLLLLAPQARPVSPCILTANRNEQYYL